MEPTTIAALSLAAAPAIASAFGGKKKYEQQPFLTPQQIEAQRMLRDFAQTGKFGEFQAGAEVSLGYGDYGPTGIEQTGLSSLQSLLSGGVPDRYKLGDMALQDFLQTSPQAIEAQFNPFKEQVGRQMRESETALKRGAGFAGNLYSTDTIKRLGDLQARGTETLTSELARLTNEALNRRLQAIPLAYQSAREQEATALNRIEASQRFGSLTRQLNDAQIKARDAELLRRRQELQMPIQAATSLSGASAQFGVPSITTSPYQDLLNMAGTIGGQYLGNELFGGQYKRLYGNPTATSPVPASGFGTFNRRGFLQY